MVRSTSPERAGGTHHDLPVHEMLLVLETDRTHGLTEAEAARRRERFGPNELPEVSTDGALVRLLRQLHHPLIYVLLASALVTLLLGEYVDSSVILGVVVVNTLIGYLQESKAASALDALRSLVRTEARVVRDGRQGMVHSRDVVPGDLVLLDAGDKVPADLRLIEQAELHVDESALTGESVPVLKDESVLPSHTPVADRRNMTYSGTLVTAGTGRGVTVATGADTELGEIHQLVGAADSLATPLTRKLAWFSKVLTVVILGLAAVTFAVGVLRGQPASEMFVAAVALAVGAIPEGLPAAVTITLAIGVARMARRGAVIRRLPAVETLGGATVICSDKTGTLTENEMTVRTVWVPDDEITVTGSGYGAEGALLHADGTPVAPRSPGEALRWCLAAGAHCNDARLTEDGGIVGDPTEAAMLVAAHKLDANPAPLPRVDSLPFSSERQLMATLHTVPATAERIVLVKGAVERVLDLCTAQMGHDGTAEPLDRAAALDAAARLARGGMRVLATAVRRHDVDGFADADPGPLVLTGLQAMLDPPRTSAANAVRSCATAGIAVKMITGDHAHTARAIARAIDLLTDERGGALTGSELETLTDDELPDAVDDTSVFARVSPEQKLRLVKALQSRNHVVAMTGDGVNDAPALKQADIGIAMGRGGTEVAKEAGDMVLTDDDFATIEAAVEEGRGVFDNLTKFIVWTLPTNMAEALVILVAVFLGTALPILPTQILWINMTTAVALGLMLAWEPKEPGIMTRPPRDPLESLLTRALVVRTLLVSAGLVAGTWLLFRYELAGGASVEESRTMAVNLFVVVEIFYLYSCRSLTRPAWRIGFFSNRWLLVGVTVQVACQLLLTYLPAMNHLFQTAPISGDAWLRITGAAIVVSAMVSVHKWVLVKTG